MESVLAAIISSEDSRAQSIVQDLCNDPVAQSILDRVDSGPFGPDGRRQRSVDPSQDNFYASIITSQPRSLSIRARRQSRSTRETVTQSDTSDAARPTLGWQDQLSQSLLRRPSQITRHSGAFMNEHEAQFSDAGTSGGRARQKRRLDSSAPEIFEHVRVLPEQFDELDAAEEDLDDCADAFGNLSIDENREVRYHGNMSGLHILARHERNDTRNVDGMWKFPMVKACPTHWSPVPVMPAELRQAPESEIPLPPIHEQEHLIELYFAYVHPSFPVLDKEAFMADFNAKKMGYKEPPEEHITTTPYISVGKMQKLTDLLLFAIFVIAARFSETEIEVAQRYGVDIGSRYTFCARKALDKVYQESRTSTCQALLLLGIREFGIGSLEEGWLHVGMAVRMAIDLGLNRSSEKWQHKGRDVFSPAERYIRRRIWWACCIADKFGSTFLGRPTAIHEGDSSTPMPFVPEDDQQQLWAPCHPNALGLEVAPVAASIDACFREAAGLSVIAGEIAEKIYPVSRTLSVPRRTLMEQLHDRLLQWLVNLPEPLQYPPTSEQPPPAPHILALHEQYWALVLLLHRAFLPKESQLRANPSAEIVAADPVPWKALDICQSAAHHIAYYAKAIQANYNLSWALSLIAPGLQMAGIMHLIVLKSRPSDTQASVGLQDCITCLVHIGRTWQAAARHGNLLRGAKVQLDSRCAAHDTGSRPSKRVADAAFVQEVSLPSGMASHDYTHHYTRTEAPPAGHHITIPLELEAQAVADLPPLGPVNVDTSTAAMHMLSRFEWWQHYSAPEGEHSPPASSYQGVPSQPFTFDHQQFSPQFMQGIRDPVLHFPAAYPPNYRR